MLHLFLVLAIVFAGSSFAQVIADFEDAALGTMGFVDGDWGTGISSIEVVSDPTGRTGSVLAVNLNTEEASNDPIFYDNYEFEGNAPAMVSYDLWLPADTPDSLLLKIFTQDHPNWKWQDKLVYAVDIPKEVWYPVYFDFRVAALDGGVFETKISRMGIEFDFRGIDVSTIDYAGPILVDNVKMIGAEPTVYADFEDPAKGTYGFIDGDWGTGITSIEAVDGALNINFDATTVSNDPVLLNNVTDLDVIDVISYNIFLPTGTPDSLLLKIFSQDEPNWSWHDKLVYAIDIPKDTWYPITYSLGQMEALGSDFSIKANTLGIEFDARNLPADQQDFTGTLKMDDVLFMNSETGTKWVLADWESAVAETYLEKGGWGSDGNGIQVMERREDPTGVSSGVLFTSWEIQAGASEPKDALTKTPVDLGWTDTEDGASAITIDVFVPEDFPVDLTLEMFMQSHDWGWYSSRATIGADSTVVPGEWSTIGIDLASNADVLKLREGNPQKYGIQIYAPNGVTADVLWDNLIVEGLEAPDAVLHTPVLVSTYMDTIFEQSGKENLYVQLEWDDSDQPGLEFFDIYMSEDPINDLTAEGVIRIGTDVPHGVGAWSHRPYTPTGEEKTYYYAIIAKMGEDVTELKGEGTVGPITFERTNLPAVAKYDPDFASKFTLDGLDTEFTEEYKVNAITPESAGNAEADSWSLESTDLMFNNTFVMDDDYLYISADVTDNSVLTEEGVSQAWQGDALEFFFGAYDIAEQSAWHTKGDVGAAGTGDHRWAFTAWGTIELNGYQAVEEYAGVEFIVYQKWGGDGYIIEAKINLDSLAADGSFDVSEGMLLPMKIDCNDRDPESNDDGRTLSLNWGGAGVSENWLRPSSWGYLLVGEPTVAIDDEVQTAIKFELYDNFPNPFNPTTNIKFQIPAAGPVQLVVYDMLGNKIKTIVNERRTAGEYDVQWDGTNDMGINVSTGLYFYKLTSDNHVATKKMMFIK